MHPNIPATWRSSGCRGDFIIRRHTPPVAKAIGKPIVRVGGVVSHQQTRFIDAVAMFETRHSPFTGDSLSQQSALLLQTPFGTSIWAGAVWLSCRAVQVHGATNKDRADDCGEVHLFLLRCIQRRPLTDSCTLLASYYLAPAATGSTRCKTRGNHKTESLGRG